MLLLVIANLVNSWAWAGGLRIHILLKVLIVVITLYRFSKRYQIEILHNFWTLIAQFSLVTHFATSLSSTSLCEILAVELFCVVHEI